MKDKLMELWERFSQSRAWPFIKSTLIVIGLFALMVQIWTPSHSWDNHVTYNTFIKTLHDGGIQKVTIDDESIVYETKDGESSSVINPGDKDLVNELLKYDVNFKKKEVERPGLLMTIFISWFPMLVLISVWVWFMKSQSGDRGPFGMNKNKARLIPEKNLKTTFADVAGCDEAKEDTAEIVAFLKDPKKFQRLGGKIPKGALMVGPPGTGKTLIARAIAGEAKVPFFTISGSDFVEMFVGVGASRVRKMFEDAKAVAPCIIFIDEIDAVGRHRGAGLGGGHDEREQTLNQLLVEMDGFDGDLGIIVIAATNRPDVLDPALLRPGRFDRQITVGLPDIKGREQILKVHTAKLPLAKDVNLHDLARGSSGFSGADLANLVNEAAIFAARLNAGEIDMGHFEMAKDKILMGGERKSMVIPEDERLITAYHEAGHAVVGWLVPDHDPVYKVSIMPRGRALGITMFLPERDKLSMSRRKLESLISSLYGGRIAEELFFGRDSITTGAANDIERATDMAHSMVVKWGMSDALPPIKYTVESGGDPFLGKAMATAPGVNAKSDELAAMIDGEIQRIIVENYARATQLIKENSAKVRAMAELLMEKETIDQEDIRRIMEGK
jgi:cell division protease FtsH